MWQRKSNHSLVIFPMFLSLLKLTQILLGTLGFLFSLSLYKTSFKNRLIYSIHSPFPLWSSLHRKTQYDGNVLDSYILMEWQEALGWNNSNFCPLSQFLGWMHRKLVHNIMEPKKNSIIGNLLMRRHQISIYDRCKIDWNTKSSFSCIFWF